MEVSLQEATEKLQAREGRLAEVLEGRAKLRRQLDQSHADFSAMQATLKAELASTQACSQIASAFASYMWILTNVHLLVASAESPECQLGYLVLGPAILPRDLFALQIKTEDMLLIWRCSLVPSTVPARGMMCAHTSSRA